MDYKKYIEDKGQLSGVIQRTVENINGSQADPSPYLHLRMLKKAFSISGSWESLTVSNTNIMADTVAMNSSIPLKTRDSLSTATGRIPKMGLEFALDELQLTDIDYLINIGTTEARISGLLLSDAPRAIRGIYERNESMFLNGLSTGVALVNDDQTVGIGIRLDYGYLSANKFGVTTLWSNVASKPFDDIQRVLDKSVIDGNTITKIMLDLTALNNMAKTTQAKELFAFNSGFSGSNTPAPSLTQLNSFTSGRYGFVFEIVNKSFRFEKDGTQTVLKPWADGAVVFLTQDEVGTLTYAALAEANPTHQLKNVNYQLIDDFILLSQYGQNKPYLAQFTNTQARVAPVINNIYQIYLLDSKTVQA